MKVIHIDSEKTWRGGQKQVCLLMQGLVDAGVECHLGACRESEIVKRQTARAQLLFLRFSGVHSVLSAWRLARYCAERKIDVIDAHSSKAHTVALLAKYMGCTAKLVVHRRVDYTPGGNWLSRRKYLSKHVDRYVAISGAVRRILLALGIEEHRVCQVNSATDDRPFLNQSKDKAKERLIQMVGIDGSTPLIGHAAAMTSQKGLFTLLRSAKILKDRGHAFHIMVAGDGPLRSQLEAYRAEHKLEHHVTFLGWVEDTTEFLLGLDVLFCPSDYEALGTILLDATHAGCVLVASRVGGIPELIEDGKSGYLANPGDAEGFANRLSEVLNGERNRVLVEAARRRVHDNFSLSAMVRGNHNVYMNL